MAISRDEVQYVAKLSRIELTVREIETFTVQLSAILDYIQQLKELDTSKVEPMPAAGEGNVFREDAPDEALPPDVALLNAPKRSADMFEVPQVIDDEITGA